MAYYISKMNPYGVPLDSRTKGTKTDWSIWSATLTDTQNDFEKFIDPIYNYLDTTTVRDPIADQYDTDSIERDGMHARPVVGGFFVTMLNDPVVWKKWVAMDHTKVTSWAPLPNPPHTSPVIDNGRDSKDVTWKFVTTAPAEGWKSAGFDDSAWSSGKAGFGTEGTPGIAIGTKWDTADIWLRKQIVLPKKKFKELVFNLFHDEDVEIYVNGVLAASESGFISDYEALDINPAAKKLLVPGATLTLAVHCHQTEGGQGIDVGLATITKK